MQMQGTRQLPVAQAHAWEALNDPEVLKACTPGCESFTATSTDPDAPAYKAVTAIKIGPVSARFTGNIALANIQAPNSYDLSFEGQGGGAGFGKGASKVTLAPTNAGCTLTYTVDAQVGGKIAQLGQRLIDGVAKTMADDFFRRFEAQLVAKYPVISTPESVASNAMDTRASGQNDIKNAISMVLRDLQSPPYTYLLAAGIGAAIMMAVLWLAR